ncbi:MAG: hypothetical protein ACTS77_04650, partial [Arsenophonus sp. NC-TX2-MAG3]
GVLVRERLDVANKTFNPLLVGLSVKYHPPSMRMLEKNAEERLEILCLSVSALGVNKNKNLIESAFVTVRLWLTRKHEVL